MTAVYPAGIDVHRSAVLSDCGQYRYRLTRSWNPAVMPLPFIMLNPSTADAEQDDPTIRRCVGFAVRLGYGGVGVWNLYAYRASKPAALTTAPVPIVGPDNDDHLAHILAWSDTAQSPVVAAWGAHAPLSRVAEILVMPGAANLHCLGVTASGAPRHPLYLPRDAGLRPWPTGGAQ